MQTEYSTHIWEATVIAKWQKFRQLFPILLFIARCVPVLLLKPKIGSTIQGQEHIHLMMHPFSLHSEPTSEKTIYVELDIHAPSRHTQFPKAKSGESTHIVEGQGIVS